jgi:hypothetical protein
MHDEDFFSDHDPALAFLDWNFATGRLSKPRNTATLLALKFRTAASSFPS